MIKAWFWDQAICYWGIKFKQLTTFQKTIARDFARKTIFHFLGIKTSYRDTS